MTRTPSPDEARQAVEDAAREVHRDDKEFWEAASGLRAVRDWARARRAGPYALLGEVLLQIAARIPPQVVLPPLGSGSGTQGAASLNQLYASVGRSGLSKGLGHQLGAEIIAWPAGISAPVYAPLGSGEGIAATYVACQRDEDRQFVMLRLAWSAVFAATEVDKLAALLGRRAATLGGVLRSAWSGEPLGEANATEERRRHVARHTYRAGLIVQVQPGRGGTLLNSDETAAGTPQRILWLSAADPDLPDLAPDAPPMLAWTAPDEITTQLSEIDLRGLDRLGELDLATIPVCKTARDAIDSAAVARHRGEADALDGHALLVREKLAAVLGAFLGRYGVTDETWQLAGHLMSASDRTRSAVSRALAEQAERENDARGHAEARRAQIVGDELDAAMAAKTAGRIRELLRDGEDWTTRSALRRGVNPRQRDHIDDALALLLRGGEIEARRVTREAAGYGGEGREYRITDGHPGHPGHPGVDQGKPRSPRTVTPVTPARVADDETAGQRRGDRITAGQRRGDHETAAGVTRITAGQDRGDRGDRGDTPVARESGHGASRGSRP